VPRRWVTSTEHLLGEWPALYHLSGRPLVPQGGADLSETHLSQRRVMNRSRDTPVDPHRRRLLRRALGLEYATIGWNIGEAVLTIALGVVAGSLALIGFGSVSIVEVFASSVVVWHLMPAHSIDSPERTVRALRLVAVAFAALAVAVTVASVRDLVMARHPGESLWGIAYLAVTALIMFGLAVAKHRLATRLQSAPLRSEATMTFLDGILSTATMIGLALNAALSWWWADPAAALLVGIAAANEARENWLEAAELQER